MVKGCAGRGHRPCSFGKEGRCAQVGAKYTRCPVCDPDRMAADCDTVQGRANVLRVLRNLQEAPEMLAIAIGQLPAEHRPSLCEVLGELGTVTPRPFPLAELPSSPMPTVAAAESVDIEAR